MSMLLLLVEGLVGCRLFAVQVGEKSGDFRNSGFGCENGVMILQCNGLGWAYSKFSLVFFSHSHPPAILS